MSSLLFSFNSFRIWFWWFYESDAFTFHYICSSLGIILFHYNTAETHWLRIWDFAISTIFFWSLTHRLSYESFTVKKSDAFTFHCIRSSLGIILFHYNTAEAHWLRIWDFATSTIFFWSLTHRLSYESFTVKKKVMCLLFIAYVQALG